MLQTGAIFMDFSRYLTERVRGGGVLTYLFLMHYSLPPENARKPYGFLTFSGGRKRVHWEQMG